MENEPRQQRGLEIAAAKKLRRKGQLWIVPSQARNGAYVVDLSDQTCTCPDYEARSKKCKHIYAVEFTIRRETLPDGTTTITKTIRVTYAQNWPAYNAAQTTEGTRFPELLKGLCDGVLSPPKKMGRPSLPLSDMIFASVMKVYGTMSGRRSMSDIRLCQEQGRIAKTPHYNSIFNYLENPKLTPLLKLLVEESASPLKAVETDFAVDSSGFSTSTYRRWYDEKYGKTRSKAKWIKAHLMIGVKTNVVTSAEIIDGMSHDTNYLPDLTESTAKRFTLSEISADKAYLSKLNVDVIESFGAVPYIPFKSNSTGEGPELWRKMWHFYQFNRMEFLQHYHKRSNIESTFSMIKAKFGGAVRSKKPTAQINEIFCKVICHNLCVLIQSIYELGIDPTFWAEKAVAQQVN